MPAKGKTLFTGEYRGTARYSDGDFAVLTRPQHQIDEAVKRFRVNAIVFGWGYLSEAEWGEWVSRENAGQEKMNPQQKWWHTMQHYLFR